MTNPEMTAEDVVAFVRLLNENGFPVRCITLKWMVKFHTGYPLDDGDYHDVKLLCERFGIEMPPEYAQFENKES